MLENFCQFVVELPVTFGSLQRNKCGENRPVARAVSICFRGDVQTAGVPVVHKIACQDLCLSRNERTMPAHLAAVLWVEVVVVPFAVSRAFFLGAAFFLAAAFFLGATFTRLFVGALFLAALVASCEQT